MNAYFTKHSFNLVVKNVHFGIGWYRGEPLRLLVLKLLSNDVDGWFFDIFEIHIGKFIMNLWVDREENK